MLNRNLKLEHRQHRQLKRRRTVGQRPEAQPKLRTQEKLELSEEILEEEEDEEEIVMMTITHRMMSC